MSSENATAATTEEQGSHASPIGLYIKIYLTLLVLTYVTVQVSLLDLGKPAIIVAMIVAIIKATLVALYFMHLNHDTGFNRFIFAGSLIFLVIFFLFTMIDLGTRGAVIEEQDTFARQAEQKAKKMKLTPPPTAAPQTPQPAAAAPR